MTDTRLFYPPDAIVPAELRTVEFVLRPLRATDVELDYDAVISSREILLLHSGGRWPREGFTLCENLSDLQKHESDFQQWTSFTYTVLNPTQTECLGCVYINPLATIMERNHVAPEVLTTVGDHEAWVTLWVRQSRVADNLDQRLLAALCGWFSSGEWAFARVLFGVSEHQTHHLTVFQNAGLHHVYTFPSESVGMYYLYD